MGKNKLKKFAEMEQLDCVYQYPHQALAVSGGCPLRGRWKSDVFTTGGPLVLELGCGKGEYAVGMGRMIPGSNFIGIDIKGARMWTGARQVADEGIGNVKFLRTSIHLLPEFFAPGEVDEFWITFPDPQMKKVNKRLTGTHFVDIYRQVAAPGTIVNLKTDSPFLYAYTMEMARHNGLEIVAATPDLYHSEWADKVPRITTYYEQQWLGRGIPSKYIAFRLPAADVTLTEPEIDIEPDTYRSFGRGTTEFLANLEK